MLKARIRTLLAAAGYEILDDSVQGKNQTRFTHWILQKNETKYFCKVNNTSDVYSKHLNEALSRYFKDEPTGVTFLTPVQVLEEGDHVLLIYHFIDQSPVSNESKNFKDFAVTLEDLTIFLDRVLSALDYIERQDIVTAHEDNRLEPIMTTVVNLLRDLPHSTPYALELLQYLLRHGEVLNDYRLAINDVQPQNMFWDHDGQTLTVFDLEHMGPRRRYYDHAQFCCQLWLIYNKPAYAKRFAKMLFTSLSSTDRNIAFSYFRFNMTHQLLAHYTTFKDAVVRGRASDMMRWMRRDLLSLVNDSPNLISDESS